MEATAKAGAAVLEDKTLIQGNYQQVLNRLPFKTTDPTGVYLDGRRVTFGAAEVATIAALWREVQRHQDARVLVLNRDAYTAYQGLVRGKTEVKEAKTCVHHSVGHSVKDSSCKQMLELGVKLGWMKQFLDEVEGVNATALKRAHITKAQIEELSTPPSKTGRSLCVLATVVAILTMGYLGVRYLPRIRSSLHA